MKRGGESKEGRKEGKRRETREKRDLQRHLLPLSTLFNFVRTVRRGANSCFCFCVFRVFLVGFQFKFHFHICIHTRIHKFTGETRRFNDFSFKFFIFFLGCLVGEVQNGMYVRMYNVHHLPRMVYFNYRSQAAYTWSLGLLFPRPALPCVI